MNVVAVIQARMGSTRLPGKVMKEILGRPILWHIVDRLKHAKLVDQIVIATSDKEGNEPIVKFAQANGIDYYAGSELDLLDRLYQAVKKLSPDAFVWITADCPLIDPLVVDNVIKCYLDNKGEFDAVTNTYPRTYPVGLDATILSFKLWEKAWRKLKDPWLEWVPTYFFEHPEKYRLGNVEHEKDLSYMRWTVDYQEDLDFVAKIYERLYREGDVFLMEDILKLLYGNPELTEINKNPATNEHFKKELCERNLTVSRIFRVFPWAYRVKARYYDICRIYKFNPIYIFNLITRLGLITRKGHCTMCGACCGRCVYLEDDGDKKICSVYQDRPPKCNKDIPLCSWELRKSGLADKCGYFW